MVRLAICAECGVRAATWGDEPRCIAHLDDGDERKLTAQQVRALRADHRAGVSYRDLARRYGVGKTTARQADLGLRYRDVA